MTDEPAALERIPVSVIVQRHDSAVGQWKSHNWKILRVLLAEENLAGFSQTLLHEEDAASEYRWSGLFLTLSRHSAESYWHNLSGRQPGLFVICRMNSNSDPQPLTITADHDEAGAHMENDDMVLFAPIPAEILPRLENFVITYYRPVERHKRKRQSWK